LQKPKSQELLGFTYFDLHADADITLKNREVEMFGRLTRVTSDASRSRRVHRAVVEVAPLESRALLSTLTITESVSPQILWPPNGRFVPVTVSGTITDTGATVNSVQYNVQDSEGINNIGNTPVTLSNGHYSFVVDLQARRSGQDKAGRMYTIDILASDTGTPPTSATDSEVVIVPHDRGHRGLDLGGTGNSGPLGGQFQGGAADARLGAGNRLRIGGAGEGQTNSVSVPGNGNTVTVTVNNNQTNTYNITNSFNTTVATPPVSAPSSRNSGLLPTAIRAMKAIRVIRVIREIRVTRVTATITGTATVTATATATDTISRMVVRCRRRNARGRRSAGRTPSPLPRRS
jgi:hypothetical protein